MSLRRVVTVGKETKVQNLARKVAKEVFAADDLDEALDIIDTVSPDLILCDHRCSPIRIRNFCNMANKKSDVPVVVVGTEEPDTTSPAEFMQMGAHDYLHGSSDLHRLNLIVDQIKNKPKPGNLHKNTGAFFVDDLSASVSIVGHSKAALDTLKMVKLVADSRCNPVLVLGETGTGKELAAKAIHTIRSPNEQFVAVNCAALTVNLLESELFGHTKGSFTSADREKTGLLELAGTGTIFLDEISEMPNDLQAKLLRVLEEKTFRRVGGTKEITCRATIIVSSNRNLKNEVQAKHFRQDLYYRLDICPITVAPLRSPQRREDILLLAEHFLRTSTICPHKTGKITSITKFAIEALQQHDWPGNVRELRNVIERAILLETTDKIGLASIVIGSPESDTLSHSARTDKIKDFSLAKAEQELIARALRETNWQKTKAADLLGISRATLYAKVKQHSIQKDPCTSQNYAKKTQDKTSGSSSKNKPVAVG